MVYDGPGFHLPYYSEPTIMSFFTIALGFDEKTGMISGDRDSHAAPAITYVAPVGVAPGARWTRPFAERCSSTLNTVSA